MKNEFTFPSTDGLTNIHAIEWKPEKEIIAVVQIVHGMIEFIERYDRFANFLNEQGIYVIGNDHLGHGKSVSHPDKLGYFAENGNECLIKDLHTLQVMTQARFPDVPYIFLGHSMGSFLTRQYIEIYGESLSGAIIMGTGNQPNSVLKAAQSVCKTIAKAKGWSHKSKFVSNLALGNVNKKFEPARTKNDWLTKDEKIVDQYNEHPWNNFEFSVNGFYCMFKGIEYANNHIEDIPKDLPILFVSGKDDPVGNFGMGVKEVYDAFKKAGIENIQLRLYEHDRHEILNETNYKQVQNDIYAWLDNIIQ